VPEDFVVTTLAGRGIRGKTDGNADVALLDGPTGLAIGPDGDLYFTESGPATLRKVSLADPAHPVTTLAGGEQGFADGPGAAARFMEPTALVFDPAATEPTCYVAEARGGRIRRVVFSADGDARVDTLTSPQAWGLVGDLTPEFLGVQGLAIARDGGLLIADAIGQAVHHLDLTDPSHPLKTLVGNGGPPALTAQSPMFTRPFGLATRGDDLYISEDDGDSVLLFKEGRLQLLAGLATSKPPSDGYYSNAHLSQPAALALAPDGSLVFADGGCRIRRLRLAGQAGVVSTLAGGDVSGFADGPGKEARFLSPLGVAVDADGTIYVADAGNQRIRMLKPR
jgi:sugar lactone lactonase YvrE